jgi:biopolymer transport protein ExbD
LSLWDVFRSDRLEIERGMTAEAIRSALARGELHDDDLIRPAGTTDPWARLADVPTVLEPSAETSVPRPGPAPIRDVIVLEDDEDVEDLEPTVTAAERPEIVAPPSAQAEDESATATAYDSGLSRLDLDRELDAGERRHRVDLSSVELIRWETSAGTDVLEDEFDPLDEDEEAVAFTLSRSGPEKVEELDLAAMVDVAFQLVLFFLVTATTILYKSLEVPKPNPETPAAGATQGKATTLNDLKNDYILVEIDPSGAMKIDREPVASELPVLVERLRAARESTDRKAMLLSADATTPHRNAVLAYDAANEIGLGIAIARPAQKGDKAP